MISSPKDFLRALSFKRKENVVDGESSSLLNSDPKTAADSTRMASISEISWSRCTSLPVTHAPNLSPIVATPVSARTYNEQRIKPHVSPFLFHSVSLFVDFQICWLYTHESENCILSVIEVMSLLYQKMKNETSHMSIKLCFAL